MIEQISNSITFYAFFRSARQGKTGLTVTCDVYNVANTLVVTAGSATAVGGGFYEYTLASGSTATVGEYKAVFKTTDTTVDEQHVPALWSVGRAGIENLDATVGSRSTVDAAGVLAQAASALAAYDPPTNAEMEARTLASAGYATAASQATISGYIDTEIATIITTLSTISGLIDTEIAAILAKVNALPANPAAATDIPSAASIASAVANEFATAADAVAASPVPSATVFAGSSALSSNDTHYAGSVLMFTSGALDGLARRITSYTGSTRAFTFAVAWPSAPAEGATFRILGRID
jgi:hypothetical protein